MRKSEHGDQLYRTLPRIDVTEAFQPKEVRGVLWNNEAGQLMLPLVTVGAATKHAPGNC